MDIKKFISEKFEPRTASVKIPALAAYCEKGEKPILEVRGLTAIEYYQVKGYDDIDRIKKVVDGLLKKDPKAISDGILEAFGQSLEEMPHQMKIRIRALEFGLVNDEFPIGSDTRLEYVIQLCTALTGDFDSLADKVFELTGMGQAAKKKPKKT